MPDENVTEAEAGRRRHVKREMREHPPDTNRSDADYLKHHDAGEILESLRDEEMHRVEFPT